MHDNLYLTIFIKQEHTISKHAFKIIIFTIIFITMNEYFNYIKISFLWSRWYFYKYFARFLCLLLLNVYSFYIGLLWGQFHSKFSILIRFVWIFWVWSFFIVRPVGSCCTINVTARHTLCTPITWNRLSIIWLDFRSWL